MVKGMVFRIFSVCVLVSRCWVFAIARDSSFPINNEKLVSDTKQEYNRDGKSKHALSSSITYITIVFRYKNEG